MFSEQFVEPTPAITVLWMDRVRSGPVLTLSTALRGRTAQGHEIAGAAVAVGMARLCGYPGPAVPGLSPASGTAFPQAQP